MRTSMGALTGLLLSCRAVAPFECEGDGDCDRGDLSGRCLPDSACAYPAPLERCLSGWERSPNAASAPGECVSADPGGAPTTGGPDIPPPACEWRAPITLDPERLPLTSPEAGYPLLLVLDDAALVSAIDRAESGVVFVDSNAQTLAAEIESIDPEAGRLIAWIRLPAPVPAPPTTLWVTDAGSADAGSSPDVWRDHYAGVWHLEDALSGADGEPIANSAVPSEPGTTTGSMASSQRTPGVIGSALRFDGLDDAVLLDAAFAGELDSFTASLWIRFDGEPTMPGSFNRRGSAFSRLNGGEFYPRCIRLEDETNGGVLLCQHEVSEEPPPAGLRPTELFSVERLATERWTHVVLSRDAAAGRSTLYLDGVEVDTQAEPLGALRSGTNPPALGRGEEDHLRGAIDEFRVSRRALAPDWIRTDALTQSDPPRTVLAVGAIEPCAP